MAGALIVPATTSTASTFPTFGQMIEDVADNLGTRLRTTISATAVGGEPGRWIVLDDLRDDEQARATFAGGWVHIQNGALAGQDRRIRDEGYEGPSGALAVSRVFAVGAVPTNPAAGTVVQITTPLPYKKVGLTRGVADFVLDALKRIRVEARIPLTGNGTQQQGLSAYGFLTSKADTDGIYDRRWETSGATARRSQHEYAITVNGGTITLETAQTYGTSEPFELKVLVPADVLVYDSSTTSWGYTGNGLVNDGDQASAPLAWVRPIAMTLALDHLLAETEKDTSLTDAERARRMASYTRRRNERWAPAMQAVIQKLLPTRDPDPPRQTVAVTAGRRRRWP